MRDSLPPVTLHIGRKAGASALHAPRTAAALGRPLNTLVTINMGQLGSTPETIFHNFADLRARWFCRWSRNTPKSHPQNGPPTYLYVHENESGLPHTHWLVHIHPLNRPRFLAKLLLWLKSYFGLKTIPPGVVDVRDAYNPEGAKLYMVKNLERRYAAFCRIEATEGGPIARRRADTSRNLGPSVWKPNYWAYKAKMRRESTGNRAGKRVPASPPAHCQASQRLTEAVQVANRSALGREAFLSEITPAVLRIGQDVSSATIPQARC